MRTAKRTKLAPHLRVALPGAGRPNQRWSMDFVSDRFVNCRWFRILTVVDQYTRECLSAFADHSQTGQKVVQQMKQLVAARAVPESISTDNGSEFGGKAMEAWAYQAGVKLDFIRPSKPVENAYASHCTSFKHSGTTDIAGRLSDSFVPLRFLRHFGTRRFIQMLRLVGVSLGFK